MVPQWPRVLTREGGLKSGFDKGPMRVPQRMLLWITWVS
jgi:hypothetical protein